MEGHGAVKFRCARLEMVAFLQFAEYVGLLEIEELERGRGSPCTPIQYFS